VSAALRWRSGLLTKRAERLQSLGRGLKWPDNIWVGVSVESRKYLKRTFQKIVLVMSEGPHAHESLLPNGDADVRVIRADPLQAFTFLNDVEHPLKEENLAAIRTYDIQPLSWSQRDQTAALLNGTA
jgi:hypothetical protein